MDDAIKNNTSDAERQAIVEACGKSTYEEWRFVSIYDTVIIEVTAELEKERTREGTN